MRNCGFVIDRSTLRDPSDWLATDLGSFERCGPSARVFEVNGSEIVNSCTSRGRKKDIANLKKNEYLVKTVVSRHRRYTDFQRTATVILDSTGNELQMGLIQHAFVGEEHKISPHKHPVSKKPFLLRHRLESSYNKKYVDVGVHPQYMIWQWSKQVA